MRVLLTGGSGLLGSTLRRLDPTIAAPPRSELDVTRAEQIARAISIHRPEVFLHAAAMVGYRRMLDNPAETLRTNILGSSLVTLECMRSDLRLVAISTDYVYPGERGDYREDDPVRPFGLAGLGKFGGECAVRMHARSLVIRTSFCPDLYNFPFAFRDQFVSKDTVSVIAPIILKLARSDETGVINVGTSRKSLAELAAQLGASVPVYSRAERPDVPVPADTSFNLEKLTSVLRRLEGR